MRTNSICHIFIGFQRCIKIHINIDSLPVRPGAPLSLYPFFLQSCLHILSKVFRSTAKQPILEVVWIRCGSSKIQGSYWNILNLRIFNNITSIKSFDFSTLYTTIPHDELKSRLASIIRNSFMFKNGNRRYKYLVLGHDESYFVKEHSDSKHKYSEDDIIKMLEFLVDNIFVVFAGKVSQQIVGIPMGTNCAPLLADIFLYSYEAECLQSLLSTGRKQLASRFNFTYRYIDDVLSINNPEFENYLGQMYPVELEIKDTTESNTSSSYLDLLLSIGRDGQLHTSIYDKRDDFNFHITNFPFLSSNIPTSPAYGVFISQLIRYARACSSYGCFILRATRLSNKLLEQGYVKERLKLSLRKFYGRYGDLIKQYDVSLSQMLNDILWPDHIQWQPPTDQTLYQTRPFTEFWVVSIEHLRRVWHADRGRLLLRTPGPVPLGLAYVLLVEANPFPNLLLFYRTMLFEYPSVLSRFCFLINTRGAEIHVGSFFNVKTWPHPIPKKFIFCNYTWSKIACRVIFNVKNWPHAIPMKFIFHNYTYSRNICRVIFQLINATSTPFQWILGSLSTFKCDPTLPNEV